MAVTHKATLRRIKQMITKRPGLMGVCPWSTDQENFNYSLGPADHSLSFNSTHCCSCRKVMKVTDGDCPCCSATYHHLSKAQIAEICQQIIKDAGL